MFIAGLAVGFFVLLARPNPTVTTHQGVAPGDTVPLYYASKTEIPEGGSKIWYESLTVNIDSAEEIPPETVVTVSFVRPSAKSSQSCSPPADNINTKRESGQLELNSTHNTHSISAKPFYFTSEATLSLNFTVTSPDDSMLSVYIVDDFGDYECLRTGSEEDCSIYTRKDFNVSSGIQESVSETFSISSYYFIVLASDDAQSIVGSYEYEATTHFYNYTDYSDNNIVSSCAVTQEKECTLGIGNFDECALAFTSASINSVNFIPLKVVAHHRRFNIVSIVFLALFVASLTLVTIGFLSVLILTCLKRRSIYVRSGYSKL